MKRVHLKDSRFTVNSFASSSRLNTILRSASLNPTSGSVSPSVEGFPSSAYPRQLDTHRAIKEAE